MTMLQGNDANHLFCGVANTDVSQYENVCHNTRYMENRRTLYQDRGIFFNHIFFLRLLSAMPQWLSGLFTPFNVSYTIVANQMRNQCRHFRNYLYCGRYVSTFFNARICICHAYAVIKNSRHLTISLIILWRYNDAKLYAYAWPHLHTLRNWQQYDREWVF